MTDHPSGVQAPKPLGCGGSFAVGCVIALFLSLAVGAVVFLRARSSENVKIDRTRTILEMTRNMVEAKEKAGAKAPHADGSGSDWTGQDALKKLLPDIVDVNDGWGNPIRYRCPGPVHKQGWDLYSTGPNAKDDHGTFDDLCVGEDVGPVSSVR